MLKYGLFLSLSLILSSCTSVASDFKKVEVARTSNNLPIVLDGDTIKIVDDSDRTFTKSVRLACIDAPESNQPEGEASTLYLYELLKNHQFVYLKNVKEDFYGRFVSEVFINIEGQMINVNKDLVQEGQAIVYRQFLEGCEANSYLQLEQEAQSNKKGVWNSENFVFPWIWRNSI